MHVMCVRKGDSDRDDELVGCYYTMPSISKDHVDDETDQVLQAVILADSFNKRFKPLTIDRPKV
jgi:hypothetical protein